MSNQLPNNSKLTKNSQLLRDLTLSTDAPLSFCIRLLLQKMNWIGNQSRLLDLFGNDPSNMDLVDARNIMFKLGYTSIQEELNSWDQLNSASLPALYLSTYQIPYVIYSDQSNQLIAANISDQKKLDLIEEDGGTIVIFREFDENKGKTTLIQEVIYRFRSRILKLYRISFAISVLALLVPFYIRVVYNQVIPSQGFLTGSGMYIGVTLLFFVDWNLRQWRSKELSEIVARLEAILGLKIIQKSLNLDQNQSSILGSKNFKNQQRSLDSLMTYLHNSLGPALLDFPFVIIYLIAIYLIAGLLVLVPVTIMAITALIVLLLGKYYDTAGKININSEISVSEAQDELVHRFLEIKQSNLEWVWIQRLRGLSAESTNSSLSINRQIGRLQILVNTSSQLASILTISTGVWIAYSNPTNAELLGTLIAAMFFVWRVFTPFQQLMNAVLRFGLMRRQFKKLDQFLKTRTTKLVNSSMNDPQLFGGIILDTAACKIGKQNIYALTRASIRINPGEIIAVTGKSGCGKTTLIGVINQICPLTQGTLLFDGRDYRQFSTETIQKNISLVMGNTKLLPGTILTNLSAMNTDVSLQQIHLILNKLQISTYIEALPKGLNTSMSESVFYQLPKGVKKMLALAQALIKDTPILLIDDFTQGLSAEQFDSFMDILPTLCQSELSGKMRSILIATDNHHILEQANQICILDNGLTTFQGSAEDLRKRLQQNA